MAARKEATMHRPSGFVDIALLGIAILFLGCSEYAPRADVQPEAGDVIHDASITMRIKTTYLFNGHLDSCRIQVATHDGVVTLRGTVPSDIHRDLAAAIAGNADGVREVRNDLVLAEGGLAEGGGDGPDEADKTFGEAVHDASVTASVKMALAFERGVSGSRISVHTDRGTVVLTGEAGSDAERQLAARIARDTEGVKHVVSQIQIRG
jgi:hyperosmotically inducible protein